MLFVLVSYVHGEDRDGTLRDAHSRVIQTPKIYLPYPDRIHQLWEQQRILGVLLSVSFERSPTIDLPDLARRDMLLLPASPEAIHQ